ncbi:hypothetical protein EUX98_g3874 [Antrodiella citrinella]|uniref:Zinc finger Mcm10/DnaG-type domain-containing protein n=1 Tax=Antrodiella citrinella TaxID=2447956 RepID=A0A4S4N3I9_9APHY|nr:hypothetical protein EUX98_g3874 [Antrodiella citrinella]
MESTKSRQRLEDEKQAEIRRQIAVLQAQLNDPPTRGEVTVKTSPKRRKSEQQGQGHTLLAPGTPSPKRRKLDNANGPRAKPLPSLTSRLSKSVPPKKQPYGTNHASGSSSTLTPIVKPAPSSVLSKLSDFAKARNVDTERAVTRSAAFTERPAPPPPAIEESGLLGVQKRDENLALIEDLNIGPADHMAPFDDPRFEHLEPNSSIRLSSRVLPHDDLDDYLRGRYYLSPSKLYSVIRLLPDKKGYDVPVEGDWVTIAVIAERGPVKYSKAPIAVGREDQDLDDADAKLADIIPTETSASGKRTTTDLKHWKGKKKEDTRPSGKKYINLKLIDFGCRSGSKSLTTGGKSVIRGDAFLSLLLFEADRAEDVVGDDGKKTKVYRGGSRGAFERMAKLKEGAVVALLNPRILKPFQRSGDTPHPTDNILAVTPDSIDSTVVIGHAKDLGMCKAIKRDGKPCGSWCDKRVSEICDWHVQHAIQGNRAARAEFAIGYVLHVFFLLVKRTVQILIVPYDPARQWGLKPEPSRSQADGATYVVSGHVVSGGADVQSLFVSENIGRDAQAKAARVAAKKDADRALEGLLKQDKEGTRALAAAQAFRVKAKMEKAKEKSLGKKDKKTGGKKDDSAKSKDKPQVSKKRKRSESSSPSSSEDEAEEKLQQHKSAYSAQLIKNLGFDPMAMGKDGRKTVDPVVQRKLEALAASQSARRDIALGPRPGKKASSAVLPLPDLSDEDELERKEAAIFGKVVRSVEEEREGGEKMIDLDSD